MDLLDLYFTSIEDTTKTLSKFVKRYEKEIFSIDYEQEELGAKALRITWIRLWTTAVESRGVENAFSDPNTIDWNYLAELRQEVRVYNRSALVRYSLTYSVMIGAITSRCRC